ncbi:T9SS type A sorting domain-containing protein [Polaribacter porphyrae]|uniref:Secretion system C-terminal sorting domain-containing protein n=1 Tax=Polaribacter porphyrae TaxID=1137780 RepID=A0A2S7WKZ0_9FLAO|nr:T9SS type A sorting domain-containing protein [Polaribacter porphyrae]PQJ78270.1 hypothetical protein BTO18_03275 [Polaribacter porphyrae]
MKKTFTLICILFFNLYITSQNWVSVGISANSNQGGVYDMEFHNNVLYASVNNDGLIKSSDKGATWSVINITDFETNPNSRHISHIISTGSSLYVVTLYANTSSSMIYKSTDNGQSFTTDISGFPLAPNDNTRLMNIANIYYENENLIAVINGGNYTKKENDASWQPTNTTVKFAEYYGSHNNTLFAFPSYGIYKSTDDGQTWVKPANTNLPQLFLANNMNINPITGRIYVSGKGLVEQIHKLLYSDDEGETWISANIESYLDKNWIGLPQEIAEIYSYGNLVQLALINDNSNSGPEVLISVDSATTFSDDKTGILDLGLGTTLISKFAKQNDYVYAAVNYGQIYSKDLTTLANANYAKQKSFKAYPNPFKNETILTFNEILQNGELTVFTILGKKVTVKKGISGNSYHFERSNLSSGLYLIQIKDTNKLFKPFKLIVTD